jgi:zinc transport system ATP-binding protein
LHEKELLILDEPATGIDMAGEQTIYDLIEKINRERNTTCVIVSHELNIVSKYAKKVLCLNKNMICYGKPEKVINKDTLQEMYGLGVALYHSH